MEPQDLSPGLPDAIDEKKAAAESWFRELRDRICAAFETLEDEAAGPQATWAPGRFERHQWLR